MIDGKELIMLRELKSKLYGQFPFEWSEAKGKSYHVVKKLDDMDSEYTKQMNVIREYIDKIEEEQFKEGE